MVTFQQDVHFGRGDARVLKCTFEDTFGMFRLKKTSKVKDAQGRWLARSVAGRRFLKILDIGKNPAVLLACRMETMG
jgi:hypothetical protein